MVDSLEKEDDSFLLFVDVSLRFLLVRVKMKIYGLAKRIHKDNIYIKYEKLLNHEFSK